MGDRLRRRWADGDTAFGIWLSTDGLSTAEALGHLDVDYVVIDLQHGLLDFTGLLACLRALTGTDATVLCRVPSNDAVQIGRVLDAGAQGVIVPMIDSATDAASAVSAARYAPLGERSFGPTRARLSGRPYDVAAANDAVIVIPMIETIAAVNDVAAIAAVDGVDALYVGPADLSLALGLAPAAHHDEPAFTDAIDAVLAACAGTTQPGVHAGPDLAARRARQGFTMVTVSTDIEAAVRGATAALADARTSG